MEELKVKLLEENGNISLRGDSIKNIDDRGKLDGNNPPPKKKNNKKNMNS